MPYFSNTPFFISFLWFILSISWLFPLSSWVMMASLSFPRILWSLQAFLKRFRIPLPETSSNSVSVISGFGVFSHVSCFCAEGWRSFKVGKLWHCCGYFFNCHKSPCNVTSDFLLFWWSCTSLSYSLYEIIPGHCCEESPTIGCGSWISTHRTNHISIIWFKICF